MPSQNKFLGDKEEGDAILAALTDSSAMEGLLECGGAGGKHGPCPHPGTAEHDGIATGIITHRDFLAKVKKLPKAAVQKVAGFVTNLYAKAEQKYGPKWAKAIVATAIITLPTPVTTPAVLAMTGLAHVWTKYSKAKTEGVEAELELTADQIEALARKWHDLIAEAMKA